MPNLSLQDQTTEFLLYTAPSGEVKVEVLLSGETLWLTQKRMAELFGVGVPAISKHLKNIFESNELQEEVVVSILENTTEHGAVAGLTQTQQVKYYNLDAVISVGYRVNSVQATQFRIWATQLIKEYIIKGFAMDDERLKNGRFFGKDYFRELCATIRLCHSAQSRGIQLPRFMDSATSLRYAQNDKVLRR
ncbi:virulence RhuM family protein [Teredinibacter turnerae]|uniref:virulence RhuM family protein n=1 Tax=Teredinibacter turnerae TaxID=2426 RepID=UPI000417B8E5|nr:RhuM family protein [Teredinibacter turnerae]